MRGRQCKRESCVHHFDRYINNTEVHLHMMLIIDFSSSTEFQTRLFQQYISVNLPIFYLLPLGIISYKSCVLVRQQVDNIFITVHFTYVSAAFMVSSVALKSIYIYTIQHSSILWHLLNLKCFLMDHMMLSSFEWEMICASP